MLLLATCAACRMLRMRTCIKYVVDHALLVIVLASPFHLEPFIRAQYLRQIVADGLTMTHNKQQLAVCT